MGCLGDYNIKGIRVLALNESDNALVFVTAKKFRAGLYNYLDDNLDLYSYKDDTTKKIWLVFKSKDIEYHRETDLTLDQYPLYHLLLDHKVNLWTVGSKNLNQSSLLVPYKQLNVRLSRRN
jgi:hypothetical protein